MKMTSVKMNKHKLTDILHVNREAHINEYNEAMKNYRIGVVGGLMDLQKEIKRLTKEVNNALKEAQEGGEMKTNFYYDFRKPFTDLIKPESYEKEYTLAIDMISYDIENEIELTKGEFRQFVNDEWDWRDSFESQITGSLYNAGRYSYASGSITSYGK